MASLGKESIAGRRLCRRAVFRVVRCQRSRKVAIQWETFPEGFYREAVHSFAFCRPTVQLHVSVICEGSILDLPAAKGPTANRGSGVRQIVSCVFFVRRAKTRLGQRFVPGPVVATDSLSILDTLATGILKCRAISLIPRPCFRSATTSRCRRWKAIASGITKAKTSRQMGSSIGHMCLFCPS